MDFLGCILLKSKGFRISSIVFLLINGIGIFLLLTFDFKDYDKDKNIYPFIQILYILICYLFLFIGVGASALMSQQILVDSFYKLKIYLDEKQNIKLKDEELNLIEEKYIMKEMNIKNSTNIVEHNEDFMIVEEVKNNDNKNKNKKIDIVKEIFKNNNKFDFFFMICLTTILGYFGKYLLNFIISEKKNDYDKNEYKIFNETLNTTNTTFNITEEDIINKIYAHDRDYLFTIIIIIYASSILLSLILYSLFTCIFTKKLKEDKKKDEFSICQVCGYTIYTQNIKNPDKIIPKCECIKLICKSFQTCCDLAFCGDQKENEKKYGKKLSYCCCCNCDKINYEQNNTFFCYCYQGKRKQKWFNNYIANEVQRNLVNKIFNYILLNLCSIYFEAIFRRNNKSEKKTVDYKGTLIYLIIFLSTFALFFLICISFGRLGFLCQNKDDKKEKVSKLSNEILAGMSGITYFNGLYCFILLYYSFKKDGTILYNNYYIYPPLLMNKFYYFILTYYSLSYSESKKGSELISASTLVSIYLLLWNSFFDILVENCYYGILKFFQFFFSGFVSSIFIYMIISLKCIMCSNFGCCLSCISCICCCWILIFFYYNKASHDCWGFYLNEEEKCHCKCFCCDCGCLGSCEFEDDSEENEDNEKDNSKSKSNDNLEPILNDKNDKDESYDE